MAGHRYLLALDQGTTGSRAIVYNQKSQEVARAYQELPQSFPKPGWVEHDPEEIWQSVYGCIQTVLKRINPAEIAAIGIANQRETTILWDRETGKPVHPAIVWQCRRTAERCLELNQQKGLPTFIREKTGLPIDAYFSATKIEWLFQHLPKLAGLARQGRLCFGTPDSWLLWKLTGGQVHATDYTNASRTMLFNLESKTWDPMLLKKFQVPESILPEVKPSSGFFGNTVKLGKLPAHLPISGMAGDQQAALFGQACFEPGSVKNTYGTGCFLLLNTGRERIHSGHGLITTLGCGIDAAPVYVLEGAVFIAGAALQWLRDGLQILHKTSDSEKIAAKLPSNEGVYFVPAFVGMGAPYWDSEARGTIVGITRGTKREHLVRAALEAMAYSTREVLDLMRQESGLKHLTLKVDGGAVANRFLCQFQADILGMPIVRPAVLESTALGAAYLAGLAVGVWKNTESIKKFWKPDATFSPRMTRSHAEANFRGWLAALRRTLTPLA